MKKHRDFKDFLRENLQDPEVEETYLSVALEEYKRDGYGLIF